MAKKLKQFKIPRVISGIQVYVTFCCFTKSEAIKILDCTMYELNTYCHVFDPVDNYCIENPHRRYALFDGGELCLSKPEWKNKLVLYTQLEEYINTYRKEKQKLIQQ